MALSWGAAAGVGLPGGARGAVLEGPEVRSNGVHLRARAVVGGVGGSLLCVGSVTGTWGSPPGVEGRKRYWGTSLSVCGPQWHGCLYVLGDSVAIWSGLIALCGEESLVGDVELYVPCVGWYLCGPSLGFEWVATTGFGGAPRGCGLYEQEMKA